MDEVSPKSSRKKSRLSENQATLFDFFYSNKKVKGDHNIANKDITIPQEVVKDVIQKQIEMLIPKEVKEDDIKSNQTEDYIEDYKDEIETPKELNKINKTAKLSIETTKNLNDEVNANIRTPNKTNTEVKVDIKSGETKPKERKLEEVKREEEEVRNEQRVEVRAGDGFPSYEDWLNDLGDWKEPLKEYLATNKLKKIHDSIKEMYKNHTVFPPQDLIFNAFKKTSFANLKAVIVGQDPYIKKNQAMGLSFSVPKGIPVPGSLHNIYAALANDPNLSFKKPNPAHGDLSNWATQGVLLINAVLTVEEGKSNSHKGLGWSEFTDEVIKVIGNKKKGVAFLLWGKFAQAKKKFINQRNHKVLEYCHPSPLAANKKNDFKKCLHFSQANEYLLETGNSPINWNVD